MSQRMPGRRRQALATSAALASAAAACLGPQRAFAGICRGEPAAGGSSAPPFTHRLAGLCVAPLSAAPTTSLAAPSPLAGGVGAAVGLLLAGVGGASAAWRREGAVARRSTSGKQAEDDEGLLDTTPEEAIDEVEEEIGEMKPDKKTIDIMRKFSNKYAQVTDTVFCADKSVSAVVIAGLAHHKETLGAPLCPCRHYEDKQAEAKDGYWNCPCVPMRERHECHCMLFLTRDNEFASDGCQHLEIDEILRLGLGDSA